MAKTSAGNLDASRPTAPGLATSVFSDAGMDATHEQCIRIMEWIAVQDRRTSLELKWQALESRLFREAKRLGICCDKATEGGSPEACEMRALAAEIVHADNWLAVSAGEIRQIRSRTLADAVAKLELGLRLQGPENWTEHAREFLEDGISELRTSLDPTNDGSPSQIR